ncbi:MAG: holo-ACP synthase [Atopobiaceae bacterium]|nr:holo-ACP synthase [Atopobiaceae bacterium]
MEHMLEQDTGAFLERVFTGAERAAEPNGLGRAQYYADRFAAKEAVFKAVAPLVPEKTFDLRMVESLHRDDGSPYIHVTPELEEVLRRAQVTKLHLSITNECDLATAFVVATND